MVDDLLKEAAELLRLWLNPLLIPCKAEGHNPTPAHPQVISCTCRDVEIARRTNRFLDCRLR